MRLFCLRFLAFSIQLVFLLSKTVNLYDETKNVHEVFDQRDFDQQTQSGLSMVVFYSPWCPHCQHFVEPYSAFSDRNQDRNMTFRAVNCERLNDICRSNKHVKGYPTLVAFGLPATAPDYHRQDPKDGLAVSAVVKDMQVFVDANVPRRERGAGEAGPLSSSTRSKQSGPDGAEAVLEWARVRAHSAARRAGPDDRLADALTSLDYLLTHELLDNYQETAHTSILTLLDILCSVLPANFNVARAKYQKLREVLARAGHPLSATRLHSVQQIIDALVLGKVAGARSAPHWVVCGVSGVDGVSEATEGYTCGLWLLLHFVTVAADHRARFEQTLSREALAGEPGVRVRVPQVMSAVRALVNLFGCDECRRNFMQVLDGCWFDRRGLDGPDASLEDAQYWLFRVHDDVTRRVTQERLARARLPGPATDLLEQTVWPDRKQCPACVSSSEVAASLEYTRIFSADSRDATDCRAENSTQSLWRRDAVLAELAQAYWNPSQWYWRAVLPADTAAVETRLQLVEPHDLAALDRPEVPPSPRVVSVTWIGLCIVIALTFLGCCFVVLRLHRGEWTSSGKRAGSSSTRSFSSGDADFEDEREEGSLLEMVTSIHKFLNRRKRSRSGDGAPEDLDELKV